MHTCIVHLADKKSEKGKLQFLSGWVLFPFLEFVAETKILTEAIFSVFGLIAFLYLTWRFYPRVKALSCD